MGALLGRVTGLGVGIALSLSACTDDASDGRAGSGGAGGESGQGASGARSGGEGGVAGSISGSGGSPAAGTAGAPGGSSAGGQGGTSTAGQGGAAGQGGTATGGALPLTDGGPEASAPLPVGPAINIECPPDPVPSGGWPLVFLWNGACFRSVDTGSLAATAALAVRQAEVGCTAVIPHGDIATASDIDAMIRSEVLVRIDQNRGRIDAQKIGAMGFSAGGTIASYLGTVWAEGVDPVGGTDRDFRVAAVVNHYGPLRFDRTTATDSGGNLTGGGGLFYLHETRRQGIDVDIPGARQWDATSCFCAARGTSPCDCDYASGLYMDAYLTAYDPNSGDRICSFLSDEPNLAALSPADFVARAAPAHVAALYLCSGWKDSNVDHDTNVHQASSWWRAEHRIIVTADDGHGFPLAVCETAADGAATQRPLAWLAERLATPGAFPPVYR